MTKARLIYERERIPSHSVQFRATVLVLQYLEKYSTLHKHKDRVLWIINGRGF